MKLKLIRSVGFAHYFLNYIFNFFRKSKIQYNLHFTSVHIKSENITYHTDHTTLKSFAVSSCCYFQANSGISLGRNFLFAPGVKIISSNHDVNDLSKNLICRPILIGDNVWIGANVTILPEVVLGNNIIVGAGSVVTKPFPEDNCIIAGNPAKIIRFIDEK